METMADTLAASIDAGLEGLRADIGENARALATTGLTGPEAEQVLAHTLRQHPWAISSLVISPEGVVLTAVPANFAGIVGEDLGWQPQVQTAHSLQAPIVSDVFMMAEGFAGISQSYPIFSPSGEYLGYTDITYTPGAFIERQIRPMVTGTGYDVWVAQTDGTVIYDTNVEEIGRNLFTDPACDDPAMQEIFGRIVAEPAGAGVYTFRDENWDKTVTKAAVWTTAGIDGAEWRVVITRTERRSVQTSPPLPAPSPGEATDGR